MRNKGFLYVATGDSITWYKHGGTPTLTNGSDFYSMKIRDYIRSSSVGSCRLFNKGIGGSTTTDMIQNTSWLTSLEPDLVTIGIGTNDCVNGPNVATYQINLGLLIDRYRMQNPNIKIILCVPPRTLDASRLAAIQPYRDAMATVATNKNVGIVHWENAWTAAEDSTCISSDNIHMTPTGQTKLYNALLPVVQALLGI